PVMVATLAPGQHQRAAGLLLGLHQRSEIVIEDRHLLLVEAAKHGGGDLIGKPEIHIAISKHRRLGFADAMDRMLVDLRPATKQKLSGLLTRRVAKQREFADALITECLTTELYQDLAGFGLHCTAELRSDDKMPNITFSVRNSNMCIGIIIMDGWSGLLLVSDRAQDNKSSNKAYGGPEEFQEAVWQIIESYTARASATG
ncbi:MAG: hypothetical protein WC454_10000, partial [Phycisphaerae bacterium]